MESGLSITSAHDCCTLKIPMIPLLSLCPPQRGHCSCAAQISHYTPQGGTAAMICTFSARKITQELHSTSSIVLYLFSMPSSLFGYRGYGTGFMHSRPCQEWSRRIRMCVWPHRGKYYRTVEQVGFARTSASHGKFRKRGIEPASSSSRGIRLTRVSLL